MCWLLNFIKRFYLANSEELNFRCPANAEIELLLFETDEVWSFVGNKENKRWIWLIMERRTRQIIAVHIGDRSQDSADALWAKVPIEVKKQALVLTDKREAYGIVIPDVQHTACEKQSGEVSLIERFNCTLRQRVSRLVRRSLSFSKSEWLYEEAIKYFICYYNLEC